MRFFCSLLYYKYIQIGLNEILIQHGNIMLEFQRFYMFAIYLVDYHTSHFLTGFIGEPSGQLKSSANSFRLLNGPSTRNWAGEWTPVVIRIFIDSAKRFDPCIFPRYFIQFQSNFTVYMCTWPINRTPSLCCWYPKHLLWRILQTRQFWFGPIIFFPFLIRQIRFFDTAIVSNIFALCINPIQLMCEMKQKKTNHQIEFMKINLFE